ncbi:5861_t:CDS:2 [Funneliformis caledonium]|uniref:5861_t:CDS:1 n=1 Tax=Funneliformis caledonium TaxID=1117310 RepID=A0A9N9GLS1_9GLOM|nr:5861_t:CDS:2 [Funneliformis caledonium]
MGRHSISRVEAPKLYNPYSYHRPHFVRWKGSVIPKVLPSTIVVTIIAVIVCIIQLVVGIKISIQSSFITILGFVVGLLLTYRTNTAYDRYWEGRRLWSTMVVSIRNLTRNIWVNIQEGDDEINDLLEKKTAINLLLGFAVATKHYLREEEGSQYADLKPLISNIKTSLPGFKPLDEQDLSENEIKTDWVYNSKNRPFGPEEVTASEARRLSLDEVRDLLTTSFIADKRVSLDNTINEGSITGPFGAKCCWFDSSRTLCLGLFDPPALDIITVLYLWISTVISYPSAKLISRYLRT